MVPESLGAELRIHYGNGCFDTFQERMVFEQALNAFLGSYKLERWASGKDMLTAICGQKISSSTDTTKRASSTSARQVRSILMLHQIHAFWKETEALLAGRGSGTLAGSCTGG